MKSPAVSILKVYLSFADSARSPYELVKRFTNLSTFLGGFEAWLLAWLLECAALDTAITADVAIKLFSHGFRVVRVDPGDITTKNTGIV